MCVCEETRLRVGVIRGLLGPEGQFYGCGDPDELFSENEGMKRGRDVSSGRQNVVVV